MKVNKNNPEVKLSKLLTIIVLEDSFPSCSAEKNILRAETHWIYLEMFFHIFVDVSIMNSLGDRKYSFWNKSQRNLLLRIIKFITLVGSESRQICCHKRF